MQRIIYSATGMSFGENIKKIRMQRAADLLQNTELKVSEIADYLGYYDTSSFRHAFRNYYGKTPQLFRLDR
jgi:two-component system response regulator YesN